MLWPFTLALIIAMVVTARDRGPMWAFGISWLITTAPLTMNMIIFSDLKDLGWRTTWILLVALFSFSAGLVLAAIIQGIRASRQTTPVSKHTSSSMEAIYPHVVVLWFVGAVGAFLFVLDYFTTGGASTSGLAELRENVVTRQSASVFGQLSQLFTWANIVVLLFALYYRSQLRRPIFLWLLSSAVLHFIPGLLTAGRQTAFQLVVLSFLAIALERRNNPTRQKNSRVTTAAIVGGSAAYMLYIAVARSEVWETRTKESILMNLFKFRLSDWLSALLDVLPVTLRSSVVEAIVYFSHTPGLFDTFLSVETGDRFWGANTFPFLARRMMSFTGISPDVALSYKVALLDSVQSIGAGWSTAYSGLILDWGINGMFAALLALGFVAQAAWIACRDDPPFPVVLLCSLMLLNIVYLPTSIGLSDTNIFLALVASIVAIIFRLGFPRTATLPIRQVGP